MVMARQGWGCPELWVADRRRWYGHCCPYPDRQRIEFREPGLPGRCPLLHAYLARCPARSAAVWALALGDVKYMRKAAW